VWILDAIHRACTLYQKRDLDVKIVSFRSSNAAVIQIARTIQHAIDGANVVHKSPEP